MNVIRLLETLEVVRESKCYRKKLRLEAGRSLSSVGERKYW